MKRENAKKILRTGIDVIVTIVSVTVEVLGDIIWKRPKQD